MAVVKSILVDIDACAGPQPAVEQARSLASACDARLTLVDVVPWVPERARHFVTPDRERDLVEHRRERLQGIGAGLQGVDVGVSVLRGRPASAVIEEVRRGGHDLLIRSHGRDDAPASTPGFGAIDMELLRQCPCPVWLVAGSTTSPPQHILAAVCADGEEVEQALNARILDWALTIGSPTGARLTVLNAWTIYGASLLKSRLPAQEFAGIVATTRSNEEAALARVVQPLASRLAGAALECVYGEPDRAIAAFAELNAVDLIVMGTVGRSGLAGVLMGNTAERVLRRLRGSVLAVKPDGFKTRATSG